MKKGNANENYQKVAFDSRELEDKIQVKLFLGIAVTSEINMHLKQSTTWANVEKRVSFDESDLIRVHYIKKDYIGLYSKNETLQMDEVRLINAKVKKKLHEYCPDLEIEKFTVSLLPHLFIS